MFFSSDVTVVQINTELDMETAALYNQTQTLPPLPPFPLSFSQWFSLLSGWFTNQVNQAVFLAIVALMTSWEWEGRPPHSLIPFECPILSGKRKNKEQAHVVAEM